MFDSGASIHDNGQPTSAGDLSSFRTDLPGLEPQRLGTNGHRLPRNLQAFARVAKHLHEVDWIANGAKPCKTAFSDDLAGIWVDGHDAKALRLQVRRDA
jgi:hypothetical protein